MTVLEIEPASPSLEELIVKNEKLVHSVARKFYKRAAYMKVDYDDLVSEGMIGLIKAIKKFDPSRGFQFSTFAVPSIKGNIQRFLRDVNPGLKFPRTVKELSVKIDGSESPVEIVEKHEVPLWMAKGALEYKNNSGSISLDQNFSNGEDKDLTIAETVPVQEDFTNIYAEEFLKLLKPKHATILKRLMANRTQAEIGEEIGVSQVQVSRILNNIREQYLAYESGELTVAKSKKVKISQEEYLRLKENGLSNKDIAEKLGVNVATIYNYKSNWEKDATEATITPRQDETSEYKQLIDKLRNELESEKKSGKEKDALVEKLQNRINELESKSVNIDAACDDIETELASVKETSEKYLEQLLETRDRLVRKDYELENNKKAVESVNQVLRKTMKQNEVLKELVKAGAMAQLEFL